MDKSFKLFLDEQESSFLGKSIYVVNKLVGIGSQIDILKILNYDDEQIHLKARRSSWNEYSVPVQLLEQAYEKVFYFLPFQKQIIL